jgi:hypothetical protein
MKTKLVLAMLLAVVGCAAMRASQARDAKIESSVTRFTYKKACNEVWSSARTMLFGQDYQVKSADAAAGLTLETEWKDAKNGSATRYLFQGTAPDAASCQVVATRAAKDTKGKTNMSRDWHMEWDLLKQVDINSANEIEKDAQAAGDQSR